MQNRAAVIKLFLGRALKHYSLLCGTMRCAILYAALLLLAGVVLVAGAADQLCVRGSADLSLNAEQGDQSAPVWCTAASCRLEFALQFEPAHAGDRRWPLNVTAGDGTSLSEQWPALATATIQCSTSGEVIVTSDTAPGGERVRLIWTYSGVASYSCAYVFSEVALDSDYRAFEALLAYSGHISSFDAVYATQSTDYSLHALSEPCADDTEPPVQGGSLSGDDGTAQCEVGACRRELASWLARPHDAAWAVLEDGVDAAPSYCHLDCKSIMLNQGGARYQAVHWRNEAAELCTAHLNAASYGCALPVDTVPALANSQAFLANPLHCALNLDRAAVLDALRDWNAQDAACQAADDAADAEQEQRAGAAASEHKQQTYLVVMIVFIVLSAVLLVLLTAMCCAFGRQMITSMLHGGGAAPLYAQSQLGVEMQPVGGWFASPVDDDPDNYAPALTQQPQASFGAPAAQLTAAYYSQPSYSQPSAPPAVYGAGVGYQ